MDIFRKIAEERIAEAIRRGEFDHLPGRGRRLRLDDTIGIPPEDRMAYRILKNANVLPEEVELLREIGELKEELRVAEATQRHLLQRQLNHVQTKYNILVERPRRRSGSR